MRCKDCHACVKEFFISQQDEYVCIGVKEPFIINDINQNCTEYNDKENDKMDNNKIEQSIMFMSDWITIDLIELDGDCTSDYAKFILGNHKYIRTALDVMINVTNPTHGYQE